MDSFWSKLLILGIVAAIGLFFIHNVYTPQRTAQEAMADSTQQSVNAVKSGVDETGTSILSSQSVVNLIYENCKSGNTVKYVVQNISGSSFEFTTSTTTTTGTAVTSAVIAEKFYARSGSAESGTITFTQQN